MLSGDLRSTTLEGFTRSHSEKCYQGGHGDDELIIVMLCIEIRRKRDIPGRQVNHIVWQTI